jgi:hypothetical protein
MSIGGLTPKSETLAGRMCWWLAGNRKTCVLAGRMCRWLADSRKINRQRGVANAAAFLLPFDITGGKMKKESAIKIIVDCAKRYHTY